VSARIITQSLLICLAVLAWEALTPLALLTLQPNLSELTLYAEDKAGFAIVLILVLIGAGAWRRCGFAGGMRVGRWILLWPLWLGTLASASEGVGTTEPWRLVGWFGVAAAVSFGEEGVFRGVIMTLAGNDRSRRAVALSSLLFGLMHGAGLLGGIDSRYVAAQMIAAAALGVVLGCARVLAQSIWPGVIAHGTLDFFGLAAADGVGRAMSFSSGAATALLGSAAVALVWGAILWRRLPGR
jgi:membrane protease YdiL (CAAX protease family)